VYEALFDRERAFFVSQPAEAASVVHNRDALGSQAPSANRPIWITAAHRDAAPKPASIEGVHFDHGVGLMWYDERELRRVHRNTVAFALPNALQADRYRSVFPSTRIEVVGTPKLDRLVGPRRSAGSTIAFSFHWSSVMRGGADAPHRAFRNVIRSLARRGDITVLGHGHPQVWDRLQSMYAALGVEPVRDFSDVVRRADLYACDWSSTIYEWAALNRPVIRLETKVYIDVPSGLGLERYVDVGPTVTPAIAEGTIERLLATPSLYEEQRRATTAALYPYLGCATARAVEVLRGL
jgi:hypothetical protein